MLAEADADGRFTFVRGDLCDAALIERLFAENGFDVVVNLAAQAGVRYSIENPRAYLESNLVGFFNILEACRHHPVKHLVYASSSSVYGGNKKVPFSEEDRVDSPVSLYAATKKSNELMAAAYSKLYSIPATGLRFFTVYGPMGRPDMAYFGFTEKLRRGETIREALRQSRIVVLDSREKMIGFANAYAPEHLIISMRDAWDVAAQITAAGSVFIGPWSPESAGDYASGTNHTLPTGGWARAYSGVNTDSFLRKITYQELSRKGLATLSPTVIAMAEAEGLGAHAAAVRVRMKGGVL